MLGNLLSCAADEAVSFAKVLMIFRPDSLIEYCEILRSLFSYSDPIQKVSLSFVISLSVVCAKIDDLQHIPS